MQTSCQPKTSCQKTVDNAPVGTSAMRKNGSGEADVRAPAGAGAQRENNPSRDAVEMVAAEDCRQDIERQY
jgi:hypothetical protein